MLPCGCLNLEIITKYLSSHTPIVTPDVTVLDIQCSRKGQLVIVRLSLTIDMLSLWLTWGYKITALALAAYISDWSVKKSLYLTKIRHWDIARLQSTKLFATIKLKSHQSHKRELTKNRKTIKFSPSHTTTSQTSYGKRRRLMKRSTLEERFSISLHFSLIPPRVKKISDSNIFNFKVINYI